MIALPGVNLNPLWSGLRCVLCGREYPPHTDTDGLRFVCDDCGDEGILDAEYDYDAIGAGLDRDEPFPGSSIAGLWCFARLLPMAPSGASAAWTLGGTPLYAPETLRRHLGLDALILKDDTGLPSASLKDRACAMAIADASRLGIDHIACASTGNAAASLAVLAARAALKTTIFVPAAAPRAKLAQLLLHGARVVRVDGSYDEAFDLSLREMKRHGWYSRNCAHNPLLVEGKKTVAFELAAALQWQTPDVVLVPTGDGCIVSSVAKGFRELHEVDLIDRLPRVYGVQAAGAAPLADAWRKLGTDSATLSGRQILEAVQPVTARTIADSIQVGIPRNRVKAWRRVAATGGGFLAVPDEAILEAIHLLASQAGVFAEPSGAAGLAGVLAARDAGLLGDKESVAVIVTGHGLKDAGAALELVEIPEPIDPKAQTPNQ